MPAGTLAFDDSDWRAWICPTTGPSNCPSRTILRSSKGFYPLGRNYPETSVGWYRRVFELPAADAGKRITIEFDGAYRETMVVFNGFYIGRHSGGYDPFSFDVTDFMNPGRPKRSAGARGCDLERWLVLRRRGNLPARLAGEDASGACEAVGHVRAPKCGPATRRSRFAPRWTTTARGAQNVRVISTILDPSGKPVGKVGCARGVHREGGEQTYEQTDRGEAARCCGRSKNEISTSW